MFDGLQAFAAGVLCGAVSLLVTYLTLKLHYERISPPMALILRRGEHRRVRLRSCLIWPGTELERLVLRPHSFELGLQGEECVWTRDRAAVDVVAHVTLHVVREPARILEVTDWLGCDAAADSKVIRDLFAPAFEEALHAVASTFTGEEVYARRLEFRDRVREIVSPALRGFEIDELAISTFQKIASP